jgi:hypothetical protein
MFSHSGQQTVMQTTIWVVARSRERLAVIKQGLQRFLMEKFNLKKLNEIEGKVSRWGLI